MPAGMVSPAQSGLCGPASRVQRAVVHGGIVVVVLAGVSVVEEVVREVEDVGDGLVVVVEIVVLVVVLVGAPQVPVASQTSPVQALPAAA